jgi:hypothetical protein
MLRELYTIIAAAAQGQLEARFSRQTDQHVFVLIRIAQLELL